MTARTSLGLGVFSRKIIAAGLLLSTWYGRTCQAGAELVQELVWNRQLFTLQSDESRQVPLY